VSEYKRIILEWVDAKGWIRFNFRRIVSNGRLFEHGKEHLGSIQAGNFLPG
jgi:hypothetical protein